MGNKDARGREKKKPKQKKPKLEAVRPAIVRFVKEATPEKSRLGRAPPGR